jgi:hypothetical protein
MFVLSLQKQLQQQNAQKEIIAHLVLLKEAKIQLVQAITLQ